MLSSLPKLADRAFILGALLPSLLFGVSLLFLFYDQPQFSQFIDAVVAKDVAKDIIGKGVYFLLAVWVMAVLILMLNLPLYRFLEGYTFPKWLAKPLKERHSKRLEADLSEIKSLYDLWNKEGEKFPADKFDRYVALRKQLVRSMPSLKADVLPTRFGNVIKAFEVYPRDIYGADGIVIWLRLVSVLPNSFLELIQGVRSQIDFLVNCCLFSTIIFLLGVGRLIYSADWRWIFWIAGSLVAAHVFYQWAVSRIPAWGELVMSAFDCYLPALAGQFGFELPSSEAERRSFWTTFSQQLIYRREPDGSLPFRVEDWKRTGEAGGKKGNADCRPRGCASRDAYSKRLLLQRDRPR